MCVRTSTHLILQSVTKTPFISRGEHSANNAIVPDKTQETDACIPYVIVQLLFRSSEIAKESAPKTGSAFMISTLACGQSLLILARRG